MEEGKNNQEVLVEKYSPKETNISYEEVTLNEYHLGLVTKEAHIQQTLENDGRSFEFLENKVGKTSSWVITKMRKNILKETKIANTLTNFNIEIFYLSLHREAHYISQCKENVSFCPFPTLS